MSNLQFRGGFDWFSSNQPAWTIDNELLQQEVPEPASFAVWSLLGIASLGTILACRWRRR